MGPEQQTSFEEVVKNVRGELDTFEKRLLAIKEELASPTSRIPAVQGENRGEMIANVMLAYRHLEDARMRMGKVLQARDGGVSVYDKGTK